MKSEFWMQVKVSVFLSSTSVQKAALLQRGSRVKGKGEGQG